MNATLRIAVADDEPDMQEYLARILPRMGHEVVAVAKTGRELVGHCRELRPDLVITDIKMPDMDGIQAAEKIYEDGLAIPVVLVSAYHDASLIERAEADHIMAYLVKPIKQADLEPAISLAVWRFKQFQLVQRESTNLQQALEDRKVVERAKKMIMRHTRLNEPDAFSRLQTLSGDKHQTIVEFARSIVTSQDALQ